MIQKHFRLMFGSLAVSLSCCAMSLSGEFANAQTTYPKRMFSFDTSALSQYVGPFTLDFQLTDGGGAGDSSTSLTVDNFKINGASAVGIGSVALQDSAFFSEAMRTFVPGGALSFDLSGSYGVDSDAFGNITPDEFSFAILKGNGFEAASTSPVGGLLVIDFDDPSPGALTVNQYRLVSAATSAVPEPGIFGLLTGVGVSGGLFYLRRRKRR